MIRNEMVTVIILSMFKPWLAKWQNCKQRIKMFLERLFSLRSQQIALADPGDLSNMYYNGFLTAFHNPYSILKWMFIGRSKIDCVRVGLSWEVTEFGEAVEEFEMFSKPKFTMWMPRGSPT